MKKIIFTSAALVSAVVAMDASAAVACSGATASGNGSSVAVGGFVKQAFTPKCSANTYVEVIDGDSVFKVGAASSKGKTSFNGSSAGGGVVAYTTCATAGACQASEASAAADAAPSS